VKINQSSISGLQLTKEGLIYTIGRAPHIGDDLRERVLNYLASLEDGDKVCHGDFHPGNVLLTERGTVVIDWMTASIGNPWADVSRTSMLLTIGAKNAGKQVKPIVRLFKGLYHRAYLKRYMSLIPNGGNELEKWMPVIAAARLDERIKGEEDALIEMVRAGLVG
jgi:hypothetical protein